MNKSIGYIRVSTVEQNTERQLDGIQLDKVFTDKVSGSTTNRPELQACLEYLRGGDTLHVHSIDRLARSLRDLEALVKDLTSQGVVVQFHKEGWSFEGGSLSATQSATQTFMFQMLGAVAEFERSIIKERQAEGIAKAKEAGKYKGRKAKLSQDLVDTLRQRAMQGEEKASLAKEYGISRQTLYRLISA